MVSLYTIKETKIVEQVIKHSKFIAVIVPIDNEDSIKEIIQSYKEEYPKANHYCYAFIKENEKGMSDDKEPAKTAGAPMLQVLEKENLINVLAIVIRYFGGIKLGPGGLIRAYSSSVQEVLTNVEKVKVEQGYQITIQFPFEQEKQINYVLKNSKILTKTYQDKCYYQVEIKKEKLEQLKNIVTIINQQEKLITKKDTNQ